MKRPLVAAALAWTIHSAAALDAAAVDLHATSDDGVTLAGTLFLPDASLPPYPAVIFTHGAEPGTRAHAGYGRWAALFQERGVAALVFDKRGCGDSEGTYVEAPDLMLPADDVIAWVNTLKQQDCIRADRIGVLGWSQGGWVGPLAASRTPDLAFVVSISGPGVSPLEQNIFDKAHQFAASGAPPEQVARYAHVLRVVWTYMVTGEGEEEARAVWDTVADEPWFHAHYGGPPMMERETLLQHPRMTHYVQHSRYDPIPSLEKLRVPLLAVFGAADRVVPVDASLEAMKGAFERAGNTDLTVRVYPDADHGIRVRVPGGGFEPAPGFMDGVVEWVVDVAHRAQ